MSIFISTVGSIVYSRPGNTRKGMPMKKYVEWKNIGDIIDLDDFAGFRRLNGL